MKVNKYKSQYTLDFYVNGKNSRKDEILCRFPDRISVTPERMFYGGSDDQMRCKSFML